MKKKQKIGIGQFELFSNLLFLDMNSQETTQTEIEDIINSQKERYNEQLKQLYEVRMNMSYYIQFVEEYKRLSGIDPITGQVNMGQWTYH